MSEVPAQVGAGSAHRRRPHGRAATGRDRVRVGGDDIVEDVERTRQRLAGDGTSEPAQHVLDHAVHVAPADERVGVGLERRGLELALDQPPHRAAGVGLERAGGQDLAVADVLERDLGQRADRRLHLAGERRSRRRVCARHLPLGRCFRCRPHDVGEHPAPAAIGPVLWQ